MARKNPAPKAFDPTAIDQLLEDLKAVPPLAQKVVADLLAIWGGKPVMQVVAPLACGPGGETDPCCCVEAAIHCQVQALACMVQCQCCLAPPTPAPAPTP